MRLRGTLPPQQCLASKPTRRPALLGTPLVGTSTSCPTAAARRMPTCQAAVSGELGASDTSSVPYITIDDDIEHECEFYDWKWGSRIAYVRAGRQGPPLLLVHGFGVGAYHFERNISMLAQHHRVFAVDLLGLGQSWPSRPGCETSGPLRYSADTWTEQLHHFVQERIGEPTYLAGNSLGGFLGANLAARHPEDVKGLLLLNAAPFWSSRPPPGREGLWSLLPVDGSVPVPQGLKSAIERLWWDRIRQPETIRSLLQLVYARPETIDDSLLQRIVAATQREDALDAFASIALSPRTDLTFDEMLDIIACPVCALYGRDDPWVVPIWGQRLKRRLPTADYVELTPAGHCPHHEAPHAVNAMMRTWISAVEAGDHTTADALRIGAESCYKEEDGTEVRATVLAGEPRNVFERWDDTKWRIARAWRDALRPLRRGSGVGAVR